MNTRLHIDPEQALALVAPRQMGLATRRQLRDVGLHNRAITRLADRERDNRLAALGWETRRASRATVNAPSPFLAAVRRRLAEHAAKRRVFSGDN